MIFCAPISSLELGEEVGVFFCLCTHFYFSHGKILAWAGRKIYQGREGN